MMNFLRGLVVVTAIVAGYCHPEHDDHSYNESAIVMEDLWPFKYYREQQQRQLQGEQLSFFRGGAADDARAQVEEYVTFNPGVLTVQQDGLSLSEGLTVRILATSGLPVQYYDGGSSDIQFHKLPDAGATFPDPRSCNPGGWVYVSNCEHRVKGKGGVGAITFNKHGNVLDYRMVLTDTTMNCGGGRTPWGSWISCEEIDGGKVYEVDPLGIRPSQVTVLKRGVWESFAYDIRNKEEPSFFVTEDRKRGALQRFRPSKPDWDDPWTILHGDGEFDYLVLDPKTKTFSWVKNRDAAKRNAKRNYPNSEGIDVDDNLLYFVCKEIKSLFILDLDAHTYSNSSTAKDVGGLFHGGPDQMQRILNSTHPIMNAQERANGGDILLRGAMHDSPDSGLQRYDYLFFTEDDETHAGIHARNDHGEFFTILQSPGYRGETSGLSFSPDGRRMYATYQKRGLLFEVTRIDGLPFNAKTLNVKYNGQPTSHTEK